jgi:abequosyltransferase
MTAPLLSICIPTFNRKKYLKECLDSIFSQLEKTKDSKRIEVIISDNASDDGTREMVRLYGKKYHNLFYFRNKENLGGLVNTIKVATHAKGEYIWFFSDDDIQTKQALATVIETINKYKTDVILCNLDAWTKDMIQVKRTNCFSIDEDVIIDGRKSLFEFLSGKFFYSVDWFTTFYSCLIIKRELFDKTEKLAKLKQNKNYYFPHFLEVYNSGRDHRMYVISKRVVKYRMGNTKYGPKGKKSFLYFWDAILTAHYAKIVKANKDVIPFKFKRNLLLKRFIRQFRMYILLPILNY